MPDEKKPETKPADKPLDKPEVEVQAEPKSNSHEDRQAAKKAEQKVKEIVKKAVDDNAKHGSGKQFDAANEEIDRAKDGVSPRHVKQFKVRVKGKDAEGDEIVRERTVKPKGT